MEFGREVVVDYLAKNKIPKIDLIGAIDGMMDFNSKLEEIAKDIQEKKDNAMAMEFTKCIGELLKTNGVVPKITEYTHESVKENSIEQLYGASIDELDFSEHDKVFEDKISKMELKIQRILSQNKDLEQTIECYHAKTEDLKKCIAELEREKSEKPTKINFNDQIRVKLTPLGVEIYYHQCDELNKKIKENGGTQLEPRMPQIDKDGYTKFTLWHFMELYGQHIGMCKRNVISPIYIELCEDEWKTRYHEKPIEKGDAE